MEKQRSVTRRINVKSIRSDCKDVPRKHARKLEKQSSIPGMTESEEDIDSFNTHFQLSFNELPNETSHVNVVKWPAIGRLKFEMSASSVEIDARPITNAHIKEQLLENLGHTISSSEIDKGGNNSTPSLSPFQNELFAIVNKYVDVAYFQETFENLEAIRLVYCLHVLNHSLKTRSLIVHHNSKLEKDPGKEYRDQGMTRPKSLIIVPFRESALRVVNIFTQFFKKQNYQIENKKRFLESFSSEENVERKAEKPDDYEALFAGNVDDHFRIGISVTKKSVRLFSDFYSSDIIIASPLGISMLDEYDFLSSIEIAVLDQSDVLCMQNISHVTFLMQMLNCPAKEMHGTDISRIRKWCAAGYGKRYRQTLIFSQIYHPVCYSLLMNCENYSGKVVAMGWQDVKGAMDSVAVTVPLHFHKVSEMTDSAEMCRTKLLSYFFKKLLPEYSKKAHVLVYVENATDYLTLHTELESVKVKFASIDDETSDADVSRARNKFYQGKVNMLLYLERYHFHRRTRFKNVSSIVFLGMPTYPQFFVEMVKMVQGNEQDLPCVVLFHPRDSHKLLYSVGKDYTSIMCTLKKHIFTFMAGSKTLTN